MWLAHLTYHESYLARGYVKLAEIKGVYTAAAPREEKPVARVGIAKLDVWILERAYREASSHARVGIVSIKAKLPLGAQHGAVAAQTVDDVEVAHLGVVLHKVKINVAVPATSCRTLPHGVFLRPEAVGGKVAAVSGQLPDLACTVVAHVEIVSVTKHGEKRVGSSGARVSPMARAPPVAVGPSGIDGQRVGYAVVDKVLASVCPINFPRVAATHGEAVNAQVTGTHRRVARKRGHVLGKGLYIGHERLLTSRVGVHDEIVATLTISQIMRAGHPLCRHGALGVDVA